MEKADIYETTPQKKMWIVIDEGIIKGWFNEKKSALDCLDNICVSDFKTIAQVVYQVIDYSDSSNKEFYFPVPF